MKKVKKLFAFLTILSMVLMMSAHVMAAVDLNAKYEVDTNKIQGCLLYTSPSPRDTERSRMPSSA